MAILDSLISLVSPGWAASRMRARIELDGLRALRGYDAGKQGGRHGRGWRPAKESNNTALSTGAALLASRSLDLVRNNPWAANAVRRLAADIVGTGPTASVTGSQAARNAVRSDWDWWRENGSAIGRQSWDTDLAMLVREVVSAGDALIVWENAGAADGMRVPLRYRVLSNDYLDRSRIQGVDVGNIVLDGVEMDPEGRVVAFWLYDRHPSDVGVTVRATSSRIPASRVDLIFEPLWLGQRRGVPWLAPVALAADDLAQYELAALWKAKMAASFGLARTGAAPGQSPLAGASTTKTQSGQQEITIGPGMMISLAPGESLAPIQPPRDDNFETFRKARLHAMAAGLGMPYHALTGDLTGANYSSLREGKLLYWSMVDMWQWHMIHDQVLRSVWRRFGQARYAAGRTQGGILPGVRWSFPKRPWVDPLKDAMALQLAMDLGLRSWPDAVAAEGEDPEAQLAEIAAWNARLKELGLAVGRGNVATDTAAAMGLVQAEAQAAAPRGN
jgi:lambda family phage portal protein